MSDIAKDEAMVQAGLMASFSRVEHVCFDVGGDGSVPTPSYYLIAGKRQGLVMGIFAYINAGAVLCYYQNDGGAVTDWSGPCYFNGDTPATIYGTGPWKQYGFSSGNIVDFSFGWSTDLKALRLVGLIGPSFFFRNGLSGGNGKGSDTTGVFAYDEEFRKHVAFYPSTGLGIGGNAYVGIETQVLFLSLNVGVRYRNLGDHVPFSSLLTRQPNIGLGP